jgi:hypothetical protein
MGWCIGVRKVDGSCLSGRCDFVWACSVWLMLFRIGLSSYIYSLDGEWGGDTMGRELTKNRNHNMAVSLLRVCRTTFSSLILG